MNAKKNPKLVYNYINGKMAVNNSIKALNITSSNSITTDPIEVANYLNDSLNQFLAKMLIQIFQLFFTKPVRYATPIQLK